MLTNFAFCFLAILFFLAIPTSAQTPPGSPMAETVTVDDSISGHKNEFRILKNSDLSPGAAVLNKLKELARFVRSLEKGFEKDEFESEADYLERINKLAWEKTFRGIPLKETVFVFKARATYDAETEEFSIYLPMHSVSQGMGSPPLVVYAERLNKSWRERSSNGFQGIFDFYTFKLKVPKTKAKEIRDNFNITVRAVPLKEGSDFPLTLVPQEIYVSDSLTNESYKGSIKKYSVDSRSESSRSDVETPTVDYNKIFSPREVDQTARLLSKPVPQYTEEARQNKVTGIVVLRAILTSDRQVTSIRAVSGLPFGLTERAIAAARQIKFVPAMKDGWEVSQTIQLEYDLKP